MNGLSRPPRCSARPLAAVAAWLALLWVGLAACGESGGPRMDSNSNWLSACLDDSDCPDKSHCLCGVCTRLCQGVLDCEGLAEAACVPLESAPVDALCGARAVPEEPICLPVCATLEDCGQGQECVDGACVVPDGAGTREAALCDTTGGFWDETACGHYTCGASAECGDAIGGCDCDFDASFDPEAGCVLAPECTPGEQEILCQDTGGTWQPDSCGHYACGVAAEGCDLAMPGCDCGALRTFDAADGCLVQEECLPTDRPDFVCDVTGGTWHEDSCGHYACGVPPTCEDPVPGCDCGATRNFTDELGCVADETCAGPDSADELSCVETGGIWHLESCGHYECGVLPGCDVPTPGCDCGDRRNFESGDGCVLDDACPAPSHDEELCVDSSGTWADDACGHYDCGERGTCEVTSPGCNCGPGRNFVELEGCLADVECSGGSHEALCLETDGTWVSESCGHYTCGHEPVCGDAAPGCNCGELRVFNPGDGCVASEICLVGPRRTLCIGTDGTWVEESCGDYACGEAPACGEPAPGCNCGAERNFSPIEGCIADAECSGPTPQVLCTETEGTWHGDACGHYVCGEAPACGEPVGGCDCGVERTFHEGGGCAVDAICL